MKVVLSGGCPHLPDRFFYISRICGVTAAGKYHELKFCGGVYHQ